jgi:antitoxin PrlF
MLLMPSSTVTRKGQTTIPKEIRDYLKLRPGNRVDYVVDEEGNVVLRPATYDIRDLHGVLHRPGQKSLSVEEMNGVVRRRHGRIG